MTVDFCVNRELLEIAFVQRVHTAIRGLELESCDLLDPAGLLETPRTTCLDAGLVSLQANWDGWKFPPLPYTAEMGGYPSQVVWAEMMGAYTEGRAVTLSADGGEDIAAFSSEGTSTDPLRLLSPTVLGDQVENLDFEQELEVLWSGGDEAEIGIFLYGEWVTAEKGPSLLACRASNDGSFSITPDILGRLDPGEIVQLVISDRRLDSLGVPEVPGAGWTLGSLALTYVYYAPLE